MLLARFNCIFFSKWVLGQLSFMPFNFLQDVWVFLKWALFAFQRIFPVLRNNKLRFFTEIITQLQIDHPLVAIYFCILYFLDTFRLIKYYLYQVFFPKLKNCVDFFIPINNLKVYECKCNR